MALTVHDAHAALATAVCLAHEGHERLARGLAGEAVQVDLALQRPLAAPQPRRHVGPDTGPPIAQAIVGEQQRLDVDLIGERLAHRRAFVALALYRVRRWPLACRRRAVVAA